MDAIKGVLRGKVIVMQVFTGEISNDLTFHWKGLEKERQAKPSVNRRKEVIKIREEMKKTEI